MVVSQRIQAVAETVFVQQRRDAHGIYDAAIHLKAHLFYPAQVILCVVHDLIGRTLEYFFKPAVNYLLIKVATTEVSDWNVSRPIVYSYCVTHHLTVTGRPAGAT